MRSFDVPRQDVRDWWSDVAAKAVQDYSCDGFCVDGATAGCPDGPWSRLIGKKEAAVLDKGMLSMFKEAQEKTGPDKLIIYNPLHGHDKKQGPSPWKHYLFASGESRGASPLAPSCTPSV